MAQKQRPEAENGGAEESRFPRKDAHVPPVIWNGIAGSVTEIHQGLTRISMKLVVGRHARLRVRWSPEDQEGRYPEIGEQVMTCITADDVLLGTIGVWPGNDRWNRWSGRVVMVESGDIYSLLTVKIQGENWTLKSTNPILGLNRPPQAWDPVQIVVDPHLVRVIWDRAVIRPKKYRWATGTTKREQAGLIRLKGRTQALYPTSDGYFITLAVGDAQVSALISGEMESIHRWKPGTDVEVSMNEMDAWVKPLNEEIEPVKCGLAFLSPQREQGLR